MSMKEEHAQLKKQLIEKYGEEGALDALVSLYQLKKTELDVILTRHGYKPSPCLLEASNEQ